MTDTEKKTKKLPCIYKVDRGYHTICGGYRMERSVKGWWYIIPTDPKVMYINTERFESLEKAHSYIEERYPELGTRLCQLLMTDN